MKSNRTRNSLAAIVLSATALVGLVTYEGYTDKAVIPVPGDVPTIGFGTTSGVQLGDTIDPVTALARVLTDINKFEGALKQCVTVPLAQNEYDSFISLAYNIGPTAFCSSALVRLLNAGDYEGACLQILRWNKFKGKPLRGLTIRREKEYQLCTGEQ